MHHWSLYLQDSIEGDMIYEVVGSPGSFCRNTISDVKPERSQRHVQNLEVADINRQDVSAVKEVLASVKISKVANWSCQDFVLEGLEKLHDECFIEDYDYEEAKTKLETIFNE